MAVWNQLRVHETTVTLNELREREKKKSPRSVDTEKKVKRKEIGIRYQNQYARHMGQKKKSKSLALLLSKHLYICACHFPGQRVSRKFMILAKITSPCQKVNQETIWTNTVDPGTKQSGEVPFPASRLPRFNLPYTLVLHSLLPEFGLTCLGDSWLETHTTHGLHHARAPYSRAAGR